MPSASCLMSQFAAQCRADLAQILGSVSEPGMGVAVLYRPVTAAPGAAGASAVFEVVPMPTMYETGAMPGAQAGLRNPAASKISQRWIVSAVAAAPGATEVTPGAGVDALGRVKRLSVGDTIEVASAYVDGQDGITVLRISGKVRYEDGAFIAEAAL